MRSRRASRHGGLLLAHPRDLPEKGVAVEVEERHKHLPLRAVDRAIRSGVLIHSLPSGGASILALESGDGGSALGALDHHR